MRGWVGEAHETPEQFLAELERRAEADKARKVSSETASAQPAHVSGWPEGVIARYITVAWAASPTATVDVIDKGEDTHPMWRFELVCRGCGETFSSSSQYEVGDRAQKHAETCRALPRPEAGGR